MEIKPGGRRFVCEAVEQGMPLSCGEVARPTSERATFRLGRSEARSGNQSQLVVVEIAYRADVSLAHLEEC